MKNIESIIKNDNLISNFLLFFISIFTILCGILILDTFQGDPTIYLSYARNIANGDFFSFNPKEFSSGSTSPLWALILSLAFLLPGSLTFSKLISLTFTLLSLLAIYNMSFVISKFKVGSILGIIFLLYFLALPGLLMYESSLIICLINILILLTYKILKSNRKFFKRNLWGIALIWSAIPLVRPDAFLIVFLNLLILTYVFIKDKKSLYSILSAFLLSLPPAILYFGYSYFTLGTLSTSSFCRVFSLKERAESLLGFFYSFSTIKLFLNFPLVLWILFALWGWEKCMRVDKTVRPLGCFSFMALVCYLLMFTVISPVSGDEKRYILPTIPFIVLFASIGMADFWNAARKRKYTIVLFAFVFLFVLLPLAQIGRQIIWERNRSLNFDRITERKIVEYINKIAETNAIILVYEVQDRYYLRPDLRLLSLDGITDGKVAPFLADGNMYLFLWKYKPEYWLANDAVFYRPFLAKSILRQVVEKTGEMEGSSVQIDGITFTNVRRRKIPIIEGFAEYRQLYKISYNK